MFGLGKITRKLKYGALLLVVLFILAFTGVSLLVLPTLELNQTGNGSANGASASLAGIGDTGSGGGGGTTPAPTGNDGDGCIDDCPAVWVDNEPLKTRGGLFGLFGFDKFVPLTTGHWECDGTCMDKSQLCLFNPTDIIPTGWETNPDFTPDCICLEPKPGYCSFYDANYGVGDMNIKCGGNCPKSSMCMRSTFGNLDVCRCLLSPYNEECGLHYPEQYLRSGDEYTKPGPITENDCYGSCDIGIESLCEQPIKCIFAYMPGVPTENEIPECYCPDIEPQDPDQQEEEVVYCEDIKYPFSQKDCEIGFCAVLMYGTKCEFQTDKTGATWCQCVSPDESEEDKLLTDTVADKLWGVIGYNKYF